MAIALLKLVLTPLLVGGASLGARRWGPTVAGWIVSLPLTSGPVALFLALDRGPAFAAAAAHASLAGCVAIAGYCLAYARLAPRGWPRALAASAAGWLAGALVGLLAGTASVGATLGLAVAVAIAALALMPSATSSRGERPAPRGELAMRMVVAAGVVIAVTAAAPVVGPAASGLLAMLPIIGSILTVFAQRAGGAPAAIGIQRGILSGLVGTAAFLAVVAATIEPWGVLAAFGSAVVTVVVVQLTALRLMPRGVAGASLPVPDALA